MNIELPRMSVSKSFKFEAAHYLPNYKGSCSRVHGHSFHGEFEVSGPVDPETGMVVDFGLLGNFLDFYVEEELDHRHLNSIVEVPTAENLCLFIASRWREYVADVGKNMIGLDSLEVRIRLYETAGNFAEYRSS